MSDDKDDAPKGGLRPPTDEEEKEVQMLNAGLAMLLSQIGATAGVVIAIKSDAVMGTYNVMTEALMKDGSAHWAMRLADETRDYAETLDVVAPEELEDLEDEEHAEREQREREQDAEESN